MPRPPLSRESSKLGKSSKDLTNDDTEPSVDSIAENPPKKTALKDNDPRRASLTENTRYLLESVLNKAVDLSPAAVRPFLKPVVPAVTAFFKAMEVAMPYISVAVNTVIIYCERFYKIIEPYDPDLILPMIIGIFLTLFGGHFMMLIACFEAYRICGWDSTRDGFVSLWEDYIALKRANDEDDARDDDNDGIADVLEISKHELLTRKLLLFLRACDPQKLSNALNGIYSGFIAVSAALRIKFARTIALGVAIGDMLSNLALKMFVPFIEKLVPPAYHKWIPYIVRYGCKGIGIWIASTIERVLATFHVAFRGANMFVTAFAVYCAKRGYPKLSEGYWDELFAYSMCAFGIYMQLATGFTLGPILGLILWPFTSLETALTAYIYSSAEAPTAGAPIDLGAALGGMAAGGAPAAA